MRTSEGSHVESAQAAKPWIRLAGAEHYRGILARLDGSRELIRTLGVTSCTSGEGVTSVALGLAEVAAAEGRKVLLVDANSQRPALHRLCLCADPPGLSDVVADRRSLAPSIWHTENANLSLLPAGANRSCFLAEADGAVCSVLLEVTASGFDLVVWDLPPVRHPAFPHRLALLLDGVVWVIGAGQVSAAMAAETKQRFDHLGMRVLGTVLNRASACWPANHPAPS